MTQPKDERFKKVHERAIARFGRIQSAVRDERMQCLSDRRFYSIAGAPWEGDMGDQFANKPRFEMNKVHLAVIRIINEYRNNRITVAFITKDGRPKDTFADACDGLYRADEKASTANEAYDNAFEEGTGGGIGAWRLIAKYEDEEDDENDQQRVRIEPIFDADSCVFFDLDAKRQDKADAKHCFVLTGMSRDAYVEEYGDDPTEWPKDISQSEFDWCTPDTVYVAEYYEVESKPEVIRVFKGLADQEMQVSEQELEDDPKKRDELHAAGFREVRQKRVKRQRVRKYLMSGGKVLEDCGLIAGSQIPIVMYFGKRWYVDGVERCMGHVRLARDAQRLYNMLMSWLAEMAAKFDMEKPILTPEQIQGHAAMWANDNVDRFPYLLINPMTDVEGNPIPAGPVAYTKAPNIPPAMAALMQVAEQALQDLLGNQAAGEEIQPNLSGKAVELIQNRLDMQTFIYMSNLAKSMKRSGEIWLSMMKDIAVEEGRRMKTLSPDGEPSGVEINQPMVNDDGEQFIQNDFSKATFDVDVDVGPSSSSQRAATVRALTGLATITQDPETIQALTLATITNIEGEGMSDLRDWARAKAVRMGVVKPTKEEQAELEQEKANAKPDPASQVQLAAAQQMVEDGNLKRAKAEEAAASTKLKEAQTVKTLAEAEGEGTRQELSAVDTLHRVSQPQPQPNMKTIG